jgi:hypothetical protein
MYTALFGVFGVLLGIILTHLFAISNEWRNRRMEAMVATVVASIRALGAHEQIYRLFLGGHAPPLTDDRAVRALTEHGEAFTEWRIARARLEIVVPDDKDLEEAVEKFNEIYAEAESSWLSTYLKEGENFRFVDFKGFEDEIWKELRRARHDIIDRCHARSRQDTRWRERIRVALSNRLDLQAVHDRLASRRPSPRQHPATPSIYQFCPSRSRRSGLALLGPSEGPEPLRQYPPEHCPQGRRAEGQQSRSGWL